MDLALATCTSLPEPDHDAAPLAEALADAGITAALLAWDDPGVDWSRARLTVLRSTWNYPLHHGRFLNWAARVAADSELWNPLPVVQWNTHKRYLLGLEAAGVAIAPTALVLRGTDVALRAVATARGWDDVIVKPAVAAASLGARRFAGAPGLDAGTTHLRGILATGDALVQPYLPSVEDYGERALIWIDGELTHAVRKHPRLDGEHESVSAESVEITPAEAELARRAIAAVDGPIMYGRVDIAPGPGGRPVVMELELLEPSLYFPQCPEALRRFVAAIRKRL